MEPVHVKLDFEEAVNSKGLTLSSEINLLNIMKNLKNFKKLRKIELAQKNKVRILLKKVSSEAKAIKDTLPKTKSSEGEKKDVKVQLIKHAKGEKLETELKTIKSRLERLKLETAM